MSVLASLTKENVARLNDLPYGVPFGKWGVLKGEESELDDDSSIRSSQMQSDASDNSSNASEASVNSRFDSELDDEDYSYSRLDSLKSKTRRLIRSDTLPSTCKKCTLLACALIGAGTRRFIRSDTWWSTCTKCTFLFCALIVAYIQFGKIYDNLKENKICYDSANEGFDSGSKDLFWILRKIDNYSNWPVFKYCQNSLKAYIKDLGG